MRNFIESFNDYIDYLDAKGIVFPALFSFGVGVLMISTVVILCTLIITKFGFIGFVSLFVSTWFTVYGYQFYKYRKEKHAKT